jgi:hypothetical protein
MDIALFTLLHILVFVYWLGGDLGAFYGSTFMTNPKRSVPERMMALKFLNNIDMAPRTSLILAFPTGFMLAWVKGWLDVSFGLRTLVLSGFSVWLALAWAVHLRHGPSAEMIRKIDLTVRYLVLVGLALLGIIGLVADLPIPFFIAVKMLLLAGCVGLGLIVRRQLVPLFGAIRTMNATGPTAESDAALLSANRSTRVSVITIWILVLSASLLGIATPV